MVCEANMPKRNKSTCSQKKEKQVSLQVDKCESHISLHATTHVCKRACVSTSLAFNYQQKLHKHEGEVKTCLTLTRLRNYFAETRSACHRLLLKHRLHLKQLEEMLGISEKFSLSLLPHSKKLGPSPGVNALSLM